MNPYLNYTFNSNSFFKYSKISYYGLYDIKNSANTETGLQYSYFDECFGVNVNLKRNSYYEGDLEPKDLITIMFSFKNLGSYRSTNLAVSEGDKEDIRWLSSGIDNELFERSNN